MIHDEPTTHNEATRSRDSTMCNEAMYKEMNSLRSNDVWDMTPLPAGKRSIGLKCVHKVKTTSDSSKQSLCYVDMHTAFLNGTSQEEVCTEQPVGYVKEGEEHLVCRLKKSICGLKQAS